MSSKISALTSITPTFDDTMVVVDDIGGTPLSKRINLTGVQTLLRQDFDTRAAVTSATIDATTDFIRTAGYTTVGDGGDGLYKRSGSEPSHALKVSSNGAAVWWEIVPDAMGVNWMQGGAKGDDATDDVTAIQAVMDYAKDASETVPVDDALVVRVPKGRYKVSVPIKVYSGQTLIGGGQSTTVVEGAGFSGTELIGLAGTTWNENVTIRDLAFEATTLTVSAIEQNATNVIRLHLNNIYMDTARGVILDSYCQECRLIDIFSNGPIDLLLHIKGNANFFKGIDKEGGTGSTTDPYILIEAHGSDSNSNTFVRTTIEGTTSVNKSMIKVDGVQNIEFIDTWIEPSLTNGIAIDINDATEHVAFNGVLQGPSSSHLIKIRSAWNVTFDTIDSNAASETVASMFDIDATAFVTINTLYSRVGRSAHILDTNRNFTVDQVISKDALSSPVTGWNSRVWPQDSMGQNLLVNPSFEAGAYGWTTSGGTFTTEEYVTSEVNTGLMAHFLSDGASAPQITQIIVVGADMIGRDVTFAGLAKITGAGYIVPRFSGAGVSTNASYFRLGFGEGWGIVTGTCRILSAGNLKVGWYCPNATSSTHLYFDDCCVSVGQKTLINPTKFESIDLGGQTWVMASAAPSTGTWKVGDRAYNTVPAAGGVIYWVCVTAGSPGTWVEVRGLADQTSDANQAALSDSTGGTADGTIVAIGDTSTSNEGSKINDNFKELHLLLDEIRTTLVGTGHMKGSA